jgi:hypothetical protein
MLTYELHPPVTELNTSKSSTVMDIGNSREFDAADIKPDDFRICGDSSKNRNPTCSFIPSVCMYQLAFRLQLSGQAQICRAVFRLQASSLVVSS